MSGGFRIIHTARYNPLTIGDGFAMLGQVAHSLHDHEVKRLLQLRELRRARRQQARVDSRPLGARVSDAVAETVGSWRFIIIQSGLLAIWMLLNVVGFVEHWDPYPFILLNLVLSFQAAYTAPIIMMSQNRQAAIDRDAAQHDYDVNLKAELEIELLHQKVDLLREKEIVHLVDVIRGLETQLQEARAAIAGPAS
jgi:uncharacterized membrane protein